MINKNSLLDAYMVLIGSGMTHAGMLIGICAFTLHPSDLPDSNKYKDKVEFIWFFSVATHLFASISHLGNMFGSFNKTKTG